MKKVFSYVLPMLLVSVMLCSVCFFGSAAAEGTEMQDVVISTNAGANGVYRYNEETGKMDFVPPPEFIDEEVPPTPAIGSPLQQDDGIAPQWIIGDDNRTPVYNPKSQYASTCLIRAVFNDGGYVKRGTGWLLNDTYIMTAGHILYDLEFGYEYADYVEVYVGASNGSYSDYCKGRCEVIGGELFGTTLDEYDTKGVYDDWGVIKLDSPVTVNKDFLGSYSNRKASDMFNRTYYTQGYPADLNKHLSGADWWKRIMYTTSGTITGDYKRSIPVVKTNIDNYQGQSGSPVYSFRDGLRYTAEGILVAGSQHGTPVCNCIVLFNNYIYDIVHELMGE